MAFWIVQLVIAVALFAVSVLLAPKPNLENARPAGLGDFQVPTADETRPVPIAWGTVDMKGPNVIWYGDLKTEKLKKKVKQMFGSKKVTVGYRYFIGLNMLLCYGPIDRVTRLEISDKQASGTNIGPFGNSGLNYSIDRENHLGGKEKGGGIVGDFTVYGGLPNQNKNSYLISNTPANGDSDKHPAYVDIAHAVWEQGEIGESPNLGRWIFRVTRFPTELADSHGANSADTIIRGDINNGDANPAEVLFEILTNDVWGVGLDVADIDVAAFVTAHATLATEENGMSMVVDSLKTAEDIITEILKQIDGAMYQNSDGVFSLRLVRDDYVVDTLPIFDESNVLRVEDFSRGGWSSTRNHVNIKYEDRNQDFIGTGAMAQDVANFRTQGRHIRDDQNYGGVKHKSTARDIAARELRVASFPLAKCTLSTNREAFDLAPGDVFRFQWADLGIVDMVMRVTTVPSGTLTDNTIKLQCVQDVFSVGNTVYAASEDTGWVAPDASAVQLSVAYSRELPRVLMNMDSETFPDPTETRGLGLPAVDNDLQVFARLFLDEEQTGDFLEEDVMNNITPTGLLTATYDEDTAMIDPTGFTIDTAVGMDLLENATAEQIRQGQNLAMIVGGSAANGLGHLDEIIGWETITDNGDGTYTFTNIHRGLLDSRPASFTLPRRIFFFTDGHALTGDYTDKIGSTIDTRYVVETVNDATDISGAATGGWDVSGRSTRAINPARVRTSGTLWPNLAADHDPSPGTVVGANWQHRVLDDNEVRDWDEVLTGTPPTSLVYDVWFRRQSDDSIFRQEVAANTGNPSDFTWTSFSYLINDPSPLLDPSIEVDASIGPGATLDFYVEIQARDTVTGDSAGAKITQTFSVTTNP